LRFTEFDFHPVLLEGIEASRYENATPVQEQVIPPILAGKDIIASAQTGTGKTAAFLLPVMNKLITNKTHDKVNAVIIVPTRELVIQISQHIEGLAYFTDISAIPIYGGNDGQNFVAERKALELGADIIVCTPGRMMAHLKMGYVDFSFVEYLILDEADRMLDMGFQDDIRFIIGHMPKKRQNLLFSATMPEKIRKLAREILHEPVEINIAISRPPEKIVQKAFVLYDRQKLPMLQDILVHTHFTSCLIFCSSKQQVKELTRTLKHAGLKPEEIHSDLEQTQREAVLLGFSSGRIPILVATDILSRGIDIDTIDLVINYDVPHDGEDYVHRIGRTARAEADGIAFTLIGEEEQHKFAAIERLLGKEVPKANIPPEIGETPAYNPQARRGRGQGNRRHYPNKQSRHKKSS
jgi:superfamily II DNA/RNA helicase